MEREAFDPPRELRALVRCCFLARFGPRADAVALLEDARRATREFATRLLADPAGRQPIQSQPKGEQREQQTEQRGEQEQRQQQDRAPEDEQREEMALAAAGVAPPCAVFAFHESGRLHLPIVDWAGFRGYAVALWLRIDDMGADQTAGAKFTLFRFANNAGTLGVEAALERDQDARRHPGTLLLSVSSCAPASAEQRRFHQSAAAILSSSAAPATEWKSVQHRVRMTPGRWHLLVVSHSLHYVKKSKVSCYVDASLQFRDELVYPSSLVTASKCTIGGGKGASVQIASATMYKEELSPQLVALLYRLGPSVSAFNRWGLFPPSAANVNANSVANPLTGGFHESVIGEARVTIPDCSAAWSELCRAEVVFSFTAQNVVNEDYEDLGVEWLAEGAITSGGTSKWIALESTVGVSAEIQQRNVRIGKSVQKLLLPDCRAAWYRTLGVRGVVILLEYVLNAYDKICESTSRDAEAAGCLVEAIVVNFSWILKGLLLNSPINQQAALQQYTFHMFAHVLCAHQSRLSSIWTPGTLVVLVEVVKSLYDMLPVDQSPSNEVFHPFRTSAWNTNPLFASAVRSILLDYRLWTQCDYKTQSIFTHQLYGLACEYPHVFNDLHAVEKVLEILATFYAEVVVVDGPTVMAAKTASPATTSENSQHFAEQNDKDRHWKQQCIQTLVEIIEVCLTNQSVQVHGVLDAEILETTTSSAGTSDDVSASGTGTGPVSAASGSGDTSAQPAATINGTARRGGVLRISLENIVWSDQDAIPSESETTSTSTGYPSSVLNSIQIRFSLLRDLRAIVRFLLTCEDTPLRSPLLLLLRRLCVSFLDMRFGLVSSSLVDCLLLLMHPHSDADGVSSSDQHSIETSSVQVRMACVPVLIFLLDWLESVEGRTVWCGIEEYLRAILNGEGNFSSGFLQLMMEFYFDPAWRLGVQHSVIMNDPTKKDSVLFPIASSAGKPSLSSIHESGIAPADSGLSSAGAAAGSASKAGSSGGNGMGLGVASLSDWIKLASQFVAKKRLALSWEKRIAVIRMTALRSLSTGSNSKSTLTAHEKSASENSALVAGLFDEGVSGILSLPLSGVLPFLPILLSKSSAHFREKVLMDINVKLKTDERQQDQLLALKRNWTDALLELILVCSISDGNEGVADSPELDEAQPPPSSRFDDSGAPRSLGRAYSVEASKTGEDLVLDTIVSLLCRAMNNARGWRSMTHLLLSMKGIQQKYERTSSSASGNTIPASSIPPSVSCEQAFRSELLCEPLHWLCRATGIVIQRMARSRTILSRVLAENVQRLMFLVQESLLVSPFVNADGDNLSQLQRGDQHASEMASPCTSKYWSDAQLFLLNAVLDVNVRLMQSTHKMHRIGLAPGLQILQQALPFVIDDAMMERIVETLIESFQQEMGPVAALKVYESIPTREVFLSALVCLRRALIAHDKKQHGVVNEGEDVNTQRSLTLLRGLTLRICTSGAFAEELHAADVTVQELSTLSEAQAVGAVLDALALAMNDTEIHEREESADMVPYFPAAKDLGASNQQAKPSTKAGQDSLPRHRSRSSSIETLDDGGDRVLWAALEVEENRMLESLENAIRRERDRALVVRTRFAPRRRAWVKILWTKHEFVFRSEHEREALAGTALDTLNRLQQQRVWRIGSFETAFPSRTHRALDVDFMLTARSSNNLQLKQLPTLPTVGEAEVVIDGSEVSLSTRRSNPPQPRRHPSLTLELIHGLDEIVTNSPLSSPVAKAGGRLLERVGRVVAEQGGGEIRDITSDDLLPSAEEKAANGEDLEALSNDLLDGDEEDKQLLEQARERAASKANAADVSRSGVKATAEASISMSSTSEAAAPAQSNEPGTVFSDEPDLSGVDPGPGVGVSEDDQVYARVRCRRVVAEGIVTGHLVVCDRHLVFVPQQLSSTDPVSLEEDDTELANTGKQSPRSSTTPGSDSADEVAPGLHRCWRWRYGHVVGAYLRRYRLRDSAMELFFRNGSSHFLDFPTANKSRRNDLARLLYSFLPRSVPKQWPGRALQHLASTTKAWQNRQLSNFDYLMALNTFAGRSFNDLTQYPVFPWVLSDYESETLDLSDPSSFRDLSKPVGALNPERLQEYWDRYHSFDDPVIPKFLYGSHYSTCAGVVLYFLFRLEPFAMLHKKMQGGAFDLADRLFDSIQETWRMCNSQMSEVKELTPEFFSNPVFLRNINQYDFGKRHDQRSVSDVRLPPWAGGSPEEFVRLHRAALESEMVSRHLHEWIDLIFGFKQRGRAALDANNVFYYLTYYGVVDLDQIEDPFLRESMELQIAHFGQCPMQLFASGHPKRHPMTFSRKHPTNRAVGQTSASTVSSPGAGGSGSGNNNTMNPGTGNSGPVSYIPKPLSQAFLDVTPAAQERRRNWSPVVGLKPIAKSGIRLLKILPDRVVSVNQLGVIEMFHWKLLPKPKLSGQGEDDLMPSSPPPMEQWADSFAGPTIDEAAMLIDGKTVYTEDDDVSSVMSSPIAGSSPANSVTMSSCPWILEVVRDDSPFDYVPRVPVFEHHGQNANKITGFPVAITSNGRIIVSGGARNGALHLRLLDLDNGHVVGKASVVGHSGAVTCLNMDKWSYATAPPNQHDDEQMLVSGSSDSTLAIWRLSRVKPDLLFRLPRISPSPIMILRGHSGVIIDCCVSSYLGLVLSCSSTLALAHFLYNDGQVSFTLEPASPTIVGATASGTIRTEFSHVRISTKGYMLTTSRVFHTRATNTEDERAGQQESGEDGADEEKPTVVLTAVIATIVSIYNLLGVLVGLHVLEDEDVTDIQLSAEGDLIVLTLFPGTIRICRTEDFVVVQEYEPSTASPAVAASPVSAMCFGPKEAVIVIAAGHEDGTLALQLLPDADGSMSFLSNVRRLLGVSSKLKMVKGTVQQAQSLALSTLGSAKAVTSTARDIAGEALGEARVMMRGLFSYLQQKQ